MTVKSSLHYDDRHGWFTFTPSGRIKPLKKVPFKDRWDAVTYALGQLQKSDIISTYAVVVNARKALEKALEETRDR